MHARQRGLASVALVVMLLIMVSVAAITLSRMASSGLSESADTSLAVAALAAVDSALERATYRLGTTSPGISSCPGLTPDGVQTVGGANLTQANFQILSGTGFNGGCRVRVQSFIGGSGNPRVLRLSEGDIAGGVILPQDFPTPSPTWNVTSTCLPLPPCTVGALNIAQFGTASGSSGGAMVAQTGPLISPAQTLSATADFTVAAPFTGDPTVKLPLSFWWRKYAQVTGADSIQTISIYVVDTAGVEYSPPLWSESTVVASGTNTGWTYVSGNMDVPPLAAGQTINRIRLRFNMTEGLTGVRVGAAFDRVQVGGLIAWRELPN
jgi:hypothetical protein